MCFKCFHIQLTNLFSFFLCNYFCVCICIFMCVCMYADIICVICLYVLYCKFWMMEIMVLNSLCGMVDRRKVLSFISSRNHSRRFLPSQVSSQDSLESRRWYWKLSCFYEVLKTLPFSSFRRYSYSQKRLYCIRLWYATSFQSKA